MRKILILFFLSSVALSAQQNLSYEYDNAGNRESRTILLSRQQAAKRPTRDSIIYHESLANKEIKLYPNPVKTSLRVNISGYDQKLKSEYLLIDAQGKILFHNMLNAGSFQIDMSSYVNGEYLLRIVIDGESTTWKIIKN